MAQPVSCRQILGSRNIQLIVDDIERNLSSEDVAGQIHRILDAIHLLTTPSKAARTVNPFDALKEHAGFTLRKARSSIPQAGYGLHLEGHRSEASVIAIYPGVVYHPGDPSFLPSLRNDYIIKRTDGSCVDGKYWGLSKIMYRSLEGRHQIGAWPICDNTWLNVRHPSDWRNSMKSPLAMGQMINNHSENPPHVMYYEFEIPADFPRHLWYLLPNLNYQGMQIYHGQDHQSSEFDVGQRRGDDSDTSAGWKNQNCLAKSIAMIALRDIRDEELFSDYAWVGRPASAVHSS